MAQKVKAKGSSLSETASFYIQVFGCQANWHDALHVASIFYDLGFKETNDLEADYIVVLGCSVRQHAVDRIHGLIHKWQTRSKPATIILCGCVLPTDRKLFTEKVAAICETEEIEGVIWDLVLKSGGSIQKQTRQQVLHSASLYYLPIMSGCNRFCTYCATAIAKGRERSRPVEEIMAEVDQADSVGAKEVMLLGQTVSSYGRDKTGYPNFASLLSRILSRNQRFLISFLSPYPTDFTDELIAVLASSPRIKREFHLPLQSADDDILKRMNRRYSINDYQTILTKIRTAMPEVKISTDIIVGFPGETAEQFQKTVEFCQRNHFSRAFIGKYSPRPGTVAAQHFPDDISQAEKSRRFKIINDLVNK